MWTYILRRLLLMVPTLFGVTVVTFAIMQLAPGDPLLMKAGRTGLSGQTSQTREAYLVQKRDLNLDKPLLLNFNYFRDYDEPVRIAAHYMGRSPEEIARELAAMADTEDAELLARRRFLAGLKIPDFAQRLADPDSRESLGQAVDSYVKVYCEDTGLQGAEPAVAIIASTEANRREKLGAILALARMVAEPFVYTYSQHPSDTETPLVQSAWRLWWRRSAGEFRAIPPKRLALISRRFDELAAEPSRGKLLEGVQDFLRRDIPFLAGKLLGDSTLRQQEVAAQALRHLVSEPLATGVAPDDDDKAVGQVAENWLAWHEARREQLHPSLAHKCWNVVADTQYAHMVVRLATCHFGRSVVKTREPVGEKIWAAVLVTAPVMILAEALIYLVAVPLGVFCAVRRGGKADRGISLGLFLLYSVPPFVAGMLFLLFLCYGEYVAWFPACGLHAEGAAQFGWAAYLLDYCHHLVLPVVCLSLFSLAGMAMYSRTAMLDVLGQDYIRTARAKGLPERTVILKHAFRNALIPIVTLFAGFLPAMLGGSVIIENLFGIHGMGYLSWDSILSKDIPTVMALVYVEAILVMLSILLSDLLYVLVDPRISFASEGAAT